MSAAHSLPGPDTITRSVLSNGIVILTRSNFNSPSATLSGYLNAGSLFDSDEKLGLADFATSALMRGTEKHSFEQIYDSLETVGASMGFSAGTHTAGFSGRALVEDLPLLFELLAEVAPEAQFLWNSKQVVPIYLPGRHDPWAAVQTKKLDAVYLHLMAPKGRFAMGQITELGYNPELDGHRPNIDAILLKFRTPADLARGNLRAFLEKHLAESGG